MIGASTAFRLARGGAQVILLDRGRPGGGTSATSFTWVNANSKSPRAYHDLNVEGMRAHVALFAEFGAAPWWHGGGNVLWATGETGRASVRQRIERLRAWDYAVEEITPARLLEFEPDISSDALRDATIAYFPDESWIDATVYVHAMIQGAVRAGARIETGTAVRELRRTAERVTGVTAASGVTYDADVVVNCAGRWADEIGASAGLRIPLAPNRSLLAVTPPALTRLARIVHAPACQFRPDGGGRVMVQADEVDDAVTASGASEPPAGLANELVRRAAHLLPGLAGIGVETAHIGIRAMPVDGHSIVGPQGGVAGYYVVVTHSGVTLAPFLGAAAADEILRGRSDPRLAPFRPDRFGPS